MGGFSLLLASLIVFVGIKTHFTGFSYAILALCAYYPLGWICHHRFAVARRYRRHPELFFECTATFTNESVSLSNIHSDIRLNWDRFSSIVSTPEGLLFLLPPHIPFFWLPQRLFEGNNRKNDLLQLASEHKVTIRPMA